MDKQQAFIEFTNIVFFLCGGAAAMLLHYNSNILKQNVTKICATEIDQYLAKQNIILLHYIRKILTLNPAWVADTTVEEIDRLLKENSKWVVKDEPNTK